MSHPLAALAPSVGFPLTICVVAYGAHAPLAERFLASLYRNTDPALFYLRAGLNEAEPKTQNLFDTYAKRFGNITIFAEAKNIFKNPLMRRMFYQPTLATTWTIWCDDDTHFTRPDWLQRLSSKIECSPEVAQWGKLYALWRRDQFILDWIKAANWYQGIPCLQGVDLDGNEATKFSFATGGFWAARTEALRHLDWPDRRLIHASEDFLLGEALRQNQFRLGSFKYGLNINDAPRRNAEAAEMHLLPVRPSSAPQESAPR
jgi:GT2 family glycosyltransferase